MRGRRHGGARAHTEGLDLNKLAPGEKTGVRTPEATPQFHILYMQADRGVSLEAQTEKVRAMAVVKDVELVDVIVDAGESAKSLQRPGMARLLELVDARPSTSSSSRSSIA